MLLIAAFWLHLVTADKSYISLGDHDFVGDDKQLAASLAKLMPQQSDVPLPARSKYTSRILELELQNEFDYRYGQLKNTSISRRQFYNDPKEQDLNNLTIKMQQQAIYASQLRYQEITHIIKKYSDHPYFRISYIFEKLDEWQNDMQVIYSVVKKMTEEHILVYTPERKFRVLRFLFYYEHCVRKHVDVTYTIEYLLDFHNGIRQKFGVGSREKN